jgi:hypothetical protein
MTDTAPARSPTHSRAQRTQKFEKIREKIRKFASARKTRENFQKKIQKKIQKICKKPRKNLASAGATARAAGGVDLGAVDLEPPFGVVDHVQRLD